MKIAYITPHQGEEEIVKEAFSNAEVVFVAEGLNKQIPEDIKDATVLSLFVNSILTAEMIDEMEDLQVIALRSMGYDHVDVEHAEEKGITVTYVPQYGARTVAEHAFALMLSLSRNAPYMYELLRREGNLDVAGHEGFDLYQKTLGVIGTGNIGKQVCHIAKGFGMPIVAFDVAPDKELETDTGVTYKSVEEVLKEADVLTLHVPALKSTHYLINEESLALMKDTAYIINTARGSLVNTVALLRALKAGKLAGAGLDVFEGEEYFKDEMKLLDPETKVDKETFARFVAEHELLDMPNVIMTPHMAFNTKEAKREITDTTIQNIQSALAGTPQNVVQK